MAICKPRPRLAVFSPWPPQGSGIADYAAWLVDELRREYRVDVYHDAGIVPDPSWTSGELAAIDARLFPRLQALRDYRGLIYQMGNSRFHTFLYPYLIRYPGLVTLHDFRLTAFHELYGKACGDAEGHLREELAHDRPAEASSLTAEFPAMRAIRGGIPVSLAERGVDLNRRVFERSDAVIVHSSWCRERVKTLFPEHLTKTEIIHHGATPETISADRKAALRVKFGLPRDAMIVASLGFLSWGKMNEEALEAFVPVARDDPKALFVFVGQDAENGSAPRKAEELGISGRVRFLGRRPDSEFRELAALADVGVNLRLPPTNGETSGALLILLSVGVPTLVTDVATFADYPDSVVSKVRWERLGMAGLTWAMRSLCTDPQVRATMGRAAIEHVTRHHRWPDVASQYEDVIERLASERYRSAG